MTDEMTRPPIAPNLDPRRTGGIVAQSDLAYRRTALEHAVRFVHGSRPSDAVEAAAAFETYLRKGDTFPYTVGRHTSAAFKAAGISNLSDMQAALDAIERSFVDTLAEFRTHGSDSAVDDELPEIAGKRAAVVVTDGIAEAGRFPAISAEDADNMHHALGRPRDPRKETFRNYFVTNASSAEARRFMQLPDYWTVRDTPGSGDGHVCGTVTVEGRDLLYRIMQANPKQFRDVRIENATGRPGTVA